MAHNSESYSSYYSYTTGDYTDDPIPPRDRDRGMPQRDDRQSGRKANNADARPRDSGRKSAMAVAPMASSAPASSTPSKPPPPLPTAGTDGPKKNNMPADFVQTDWSGLTEAEAKRRLETMGANEVIVKKVSALRKFSRFFIGPIPFLIMIAAILSIAVLEWIDFIIILFLLFFNAVVGFIEEHQAGNAVAALASGLALTARVKREGLVKDVPAREVVPGDLVVLKGGVIVPADCRVICPPGEDSKDVLMIDEAALTGECLPQPRHVGDEAMSSSIVRQGEMLAQVTNTGPNSFVGKTTAIIQSAAPVGHMQQYINRMGNMLLLMDFCVVIVIIAVGATRRNAATDIIRYISCVTIAAIPIALPTVSTVTMAVGAKTIAKQKAIVTRLTAIEELATVDVLCSDKTGTLTKNELTRQTPNLHEKFTEEDALEAARLASHDLDDPVDKVFLVDAPRRMITKASATGRKPSAIGASVVPTAGAEGDEPLSRKYTLPGYEVIHSIPFDAIIKRTETTARSRGGRFPGIVKVSKGAVHAIEELCGIGKGSPEWQKNEAYVNGLAGRGYRALAVAKTESTDEAGQGGNAWHMIAIFPLYDPPREDSGEVIREAQRLGLRVKMITGDQVAIGIETARLLGMGTDIRNAQLLDTQETDADALNMVEKADGFGGVLPEHKHRIVTILQNAHHAVAMTGDGVNDAPAIKQADCGIAVSNATDAARAAASIVMLDPGLKTIIVAVMEGRRIFERIRSYVQYRLVATFHILSILLILYVWSGFELLSYEVILIAVLNDVAAIMVAYDHVEPSPTPPAWELIRQVGLAAMLAPLVIGASILVYGLGTNVFMLPVGQVQTAVYLQIAASEVMVIMSTRVSRAFFFRVRPGWLLLGSVSLCCAISTVFSGVGFIVDYLPWQWVGATWVVIVVTFLLVDLTRRIFEPLFFPLHRVHKKTEPMLPPAAGAGFAENVVRTFSYINSTHPMQGVEPAGFEHIMDPITRNASVRMTNSARATGPNAV